MPVVLFRPRRRCCRLPAASAFLRLRFHATTIFFIEYHCLPMVAGASHAGFAASAAMSAMPATPMPFAAAIFAFHIFTPPRRQRRLMLRAAAATFRPPSPPGAEMLFFRQRCRRCRHAADMPLSHHLTLCCRDMKRAITFQVLATPLFFALATLAAAAALQRQFRVAEYSFASAASRRSCLMSAVD
jgi:hypothetical protein